MRIAHTIGFCAALLVLGEVVNADIGTAFTFQGRLNQGGQAYNGAADLVFRLFDASSGGLQIGSTLEAADTPVSQGAFTVDLDFGAGVFDGSPRWLEIEVNGVVLAPRQPVMPAPYALYAATGPGLGGGGASWNFRGNEITTSDSVDITNNGLNDFALFVSSDYAAGATAFVQNTSPGIGLSVHADYALEGISHADSGPTYGVFGLAHSPNGKAGWFSAPFGGFAGYFEGYGYFSDDLGIGTTTPDMRLDVRSDSSSVSGRVRVGNANADTWVQLWSGSNAGANDPAIIWSDGSSADDLRFGTGDADGSPFTELMRIKGNGNVGIGTTAPQRKLHVQGSSDDAVAIWGSGSVPLLHFRNTANSADWIFRHDDSKLHIQTEGGTGDEVMTLTTQRRVGIGTLNPSARLHVINLSEVPALKVQGVAQVTVLEITGADLAEKFPVSEQTSPGTVMAIDPETPGTLCVARGAYNRCVAGVVSGANDLTAGAILGNLPGHEDAPPIALSGRVWVKGDATSGPIGVGDLLTTADTPGHAMRVADHDRAQGAVIGKAMTPLDEGTGLVLVLVSLQ